MSKKSDSEAKQKVLNHPNNAYPVKTILLDEYDGNDLYYKFLCGICQIEFTARYRTIMASGSRCCCKTCSMKQMGMNNRIDQKTAEQNILNHPSNTHLSKTELIDDYKGIKEINLFKCGNCENEFKTHYNIINEKDSLCCCYECSKSLKARKTFKPLEEKLKLLENHLNNIEGFNGKTIFISDEKEYKGVKFSYKFCCGDCGNEFDRIFQSILMTNSTTRCDSCSYKLNGDKLRYSLTELQNMIDEKSICKVYINNEKIKTVKDNAEFYCETHDQTFIRNVEKMLYAKFCPIGMPNGWSYECIEWLQTKPNFNKMQHALHPEGEYRIPNSPFKADGYDSITNTIYEYHGCLCHGHQYINSNCPKQRASEFNQYGKTYQEAAENTIKKRNFILNHPNGYKYEEIWECEFERLQKNKFINVPDIVLEFK